MILGAITFDKIKSDVFKKKSPKSVSDLIEQGWYLCCPGYEMMIRSFNDSRELNFLWPIFLFKRGNIVANKAYINNDRWIIGSYEDKTSAYLLILVRLDKINECLNFGNEDTTIKLKSSAAYYPMVIPLYD